MIFPVAEDTYYARLPWIEAQTLFKGVPSTTVLASCGWHGTRIDPERGAFAVVNPEGPLADLVGDRLRVERQDISRAVYVYVLASAAIEEDLSLTRRAFAALAPLWTEDLPVAVGVLDG